MDSSRNTQEIVHGSTTAYYTVTQPGIVTFRRDSLLKTAMIKDSVFHPNDMTADGKAINIEIVAIRDSEQEKLILSISLDVIQKNTKTSVTLRQSILFTGTIIMSKEQTVGDVKLFVILSGTCNSGYPISSSNTLSTRNISNSLAQVTKRCTDLTKALSNITKPTYIMFSDATGTVTAKHHKEVCKAMEDKCNAYKEALHLLATSDSQMIISSSHMSDDNSTISVSKNKNIELSHTKPKITSSAPVLTRSNTICIDQQTDDPEFDAPIVEQKTINGRSVSSLTKNKTANPVQFPVPHTVNQPYMTKKQNIQQITGNKVKFVDYNDDTEEEETQPPALKRTKSIRKVIK